MDYERFAEDQVGDWLDRLPSDYEPFLKWVDERVKDSDTLTGAEWDAYFAQYKDSINPGEHRAFWQFVDWRHEQETGKRVI